MVLIAQIIVGLLVGIGIGIILIDRLKLPSIRAVKALGNLGKKGDKKLPTLMKDRAMQVYAFKFTT